MCDCGARSPRTKAVYSISDLADLTGLSRDQVRRWVARAEIPSRLVGRKRWVALSSLRSAFPELWDSVRERVAIDD